MVRVISVHHFANQHVLTVEQPTAATVAPPNRLLLALSNHSIEVRDLQLEGDTLFAFPTVDEVAQLHHCVNGDYVATLESKFNRQNRELNFVRAYVNWDSPAALQQSKMNHSGASLAASECGMVQPMRARIAGRVTPTTNQSELASLEMIEMPVKRNPHLIAVCQTSGNLLICGDAILTFYRFCVRTHDISKLKFIDFADAGWEIQLSFRPRHCHLAENYVACANADSMHLFKLVALSAVDAIPDGDTSGRNGGYAVDDDDAAIDFRRAVHMRDVSVYLPSIVRANSAVHRHSPFTRCDRELVATVAPPVCAVVDLIQLKLRPITIEGGGQRQVGEEFTCVALKALYVDAAKEGAAGGEQRPLQSAFVHSLHSVACLIATQQEGYMHQFEDAASSAAAILADNCITVYPFTAPVFRVVLEDYFLHALTETGLESYTLRLCHRLCQSRNENISPPIGESVCLVGLRPFVGIEQMLLAPGHIVLLANAGDAAAASPTPSCGSSSSSCASTWTLYCLELPSATAAHDDIAMVAHAHRVTSPPTYCHLVGEAHMILRTALLLVRWTCEASGTRTVRPLRADAALTARTLSAYRASSALLADYYIMCRGDDEYAHASAYYKMAGVTDALEVVQRVRRLQEQAGAPATTAPPLGLIAYLRRSLLSPTAMTSFPAKLCDAVLQVFAAHQFDALPALVLRVPMLREHSTDQLIGVLEDGGRIGDERHLALAVLYALKGSVDTARAHLDAIDDGDLATLLLEQYWQLLFEQLGLSSAASFSELSALMTSSRGDLLAAIFADLIERRAISLASLLKAFVDCLPGSGEASRYGHVLQGMLEHHLRHYFDRHDAGASYDRSTHDALKLLVRSYLSQLQMMSVRSESAASATYLFMRMRHDYLNRMPPFAPLVLPSDERRAKPEVNDGADVVLKKLQALLCARAVPNQVLVELAAFLARNEALRGRLALQVCITAVCDALPLLVDECPQCALQYAKDVFVKPDEWKLLIAIVQQKILRLSHVDGMLRACAYYKKLLRDILSYAAVTMNLEHLINVFPQHMDHSVHCHILPVTSGGEETSHVDILNEIQDYEPYVTLCKETMHANQIKKLITATGQQLLCTLNL